MQFFSDCSACTQIFCLSATVRPLVLNVKDFSRIACIPFFPKIFSFFEAVLVPQSAFPWFRVCYGEAPFAQKNKTL